MTPVVIEFDGPEAWKWENRRLNMTFDGEADFALIAPRMPDDAVDGGPDAGAGHGPRMSIAESYSSDVPPFGLGEPMELRGGAALGSAADRLGCEWNAGFIDVVKAGCRRQSSSGRAWFRADPVILTGPSGAGRTHLARRLAWEAGVPHLPIDVGGGWGLGSQARGPTSARPSQLGVGIATARCANPIIDVTGIELADPETLAKLVGAVDPLRGRLDDEALGVTFDLSECTWMLQLAPDAEIPIELAEICATVFLTVPSDDNWAELAWIEALVEVAADRSVAGVCDRLDVWITGDRYPWREASMTAAERYRLAKAVFDDAYGTA